MHLPRHTRLIQKLIRMLFLATAVITTQTGQADESTLILQSTTSTANSGLYDAILPAFKEASGITVHVVAVGTGQAIKNASNGDGDVLLVHAKAAEEQFVADGFSEARFDVMYNDFVIVGPDDDPAGIAGADDVTIALNTIAAAEQLFTSRGDDSGTHKKEVSLWRKTNVDIDAASGSWYRQTGSGMGATLNIAIGMGAYTLTDRGTWIAFANKGTHRVLLEGASDLFNQYGVMLVNPVRHPTVNADAGQQFIDWLLGTDGQQAIADYTLEGQQLFFPNAR